MALTITSALKWWATERPDDTAFKVADEAARFGELLDWAHIIAARLQDMGIKPGDRVGMMGANSFDYSTLIVGAVFAGAIVVPLNFRLTRAELQIAMEDTAPVAVFADDDRLETAKAVVAAFPGTQLENLETARQWRETGTPGTRTTHQAQRDDVVGIISTSGSTARPKGVMFTHEMICLYAAEFALMEPQCARDGRAIIFAPFSSASGFLLILEFLVTGSTAFLEAEFGPERALHLIETEGINNLQGAPIFFERISALPAFETADFSSLKFAMVGGARVPQALLEKWFKKGVVLRQLYGQTEAGGGWAASPHLALDHPEKCGRGGMFTEFTVAKGGQICPPGEEGEIVVRGPIVTPGYWNNPEATKAAIYDGWLHTGDLGVLDENGEITFKDRIKDIIISGGLNISAAEVERVVSEFPGVAEVAIISAADEKFGETPMAVVFGTEEIDPQALVEHCNNQLSNYKVPRYVAVETEPLPRLASGKLAKPAIREKYKNAPETLPKLR